MSIRQAAKMLGVSRPLIYRLIANGTLVPEPRSPLYISKGPVRIPLEQIERLATEKGITLKG